MYKSNIKNELKNNHSLNKNIKEKEITTNLLLILCCGGMSYKCVCVILIIFMEMG